MRKRAGLIRGLIVAMCVCMLIPMSVLLTGCKGTTPDIDIALADGNIKLSWTKVDGAKKYDISRGKTRLSQYSYIDSVSGTTYSDGRASSNRYENYYKIVARDSANKPITIGLTWNPQRDAAKYEVYRANSLGGTFKKISEVTSQVAAVVLPEYHSRKPAVGQEGNVYQIIPLNASGARLMTGSGDDRREIIVEDEDIEKITAQTISFEQKMFGENTLFYDANYDDIEDIRNEINQIHDDYMFGRDAIRETGGQFSYRRYQLYFKPGDYEGLGDIKIGYYTSVSGLGRLPTDTRLYANISTPSPLSGGNATCTFWRSVENFEVNHVVPNDNTMFRWAVSQAAPARRLSVNVPTQFDWAGVSGYNTPWASGGFLSDSRFTSTLGSPNQQQWYTRNSAFEHSAYSGDNWNRVTQGVTGHPYTSNWDKGGARTNIDETPLVREKPFLYYENGSYQVFVPDWREDSAGISWDDVTDNMGKGVSLDLEDDFYIAKTGDTASAINKAMENGQHVFFTPGWYDAEEPIHIQSANTVLLGSGYATVFPGANNREGAILIEDVSGVIIGSLMVDAHYDSKYLVRAGKWGASADHSQNPTILSDVFLRVGGYMSTGVNAKVSVQINSNNVIGDHLWVWRADHGVTVTGTSGAADYWRVNTGDYGLIVSGDNVIMYGLFVEHYQKYQTLWLGENGSTYFYQNELPYDPPKQDEWLSHNGTVNGWAAYKVGNNVQKHYAIALGSYGVFNRQFQGERVDPKDNTSDWKNPPVYVFLTNAVEVPNAENVKIEHIIITELGGMGGTSNIINGTGESVGRDVNPPHNIIAANATARRIVSYSNGVSVVRLASGSQATQTGVAPTDEAPDVLLAGLTG